MAKVLLVTREGVTEIVASPKGVEVIIVDFDTYDGDSGLIERTNYYQGTCKIINQPPEYTYETEELEEVKDQYVVTWVPMDVVERSNHGLDYDEAKEILNELLPNITWEQVDEKINQKLSDGNNKS